MESDRGPPETALESGTPAQFSVPTLQSVRALESGGRALESEPALKVHSCPGVQAWPGDGAAMESSAGDVLSLCARTSALAALHAVVSTLILTLIETNVIIDRY